MCLVQEACKCLVGWLKLTAKLAATTKGIGTFNNMPLKHLRSRAIVGHWYPIVSINFYEHSMTGMMFLRQVYALVV